jgi:hypothetical protein
MGFAYILSQLTFDLFDVATWHFFCYSFFGVCPFPLRGGEKNHQEKGVYLR